MKMRCTLCEQVRNEFEIVADNFENMDRYKQDMNFLKRAVFSVILYYSDETTAISKKLTFPGTTLILYKTPFNILVDEKSESYIKFDENFLIMYLDRGENVMAY